MKIDLQQKLSEVLENVLEQFAFMFCDSTTPDEIPEPSGVLLHTSMQFNGPSSGSLDMMTPQALAIEIAANAMGIEQEEEAAAGASDALRELLNIICGQMLTAFAGDEPVFDITIPNVTACDHEAWKELVSDERTGVFMVEDYPFLLRVDAPE
jgi:CheY-specific phosphatase CheX